MKHLLSKTKKLLSTAVVLSCVYFIHAMPVRGCFWSDNARRLPVLTNETITALALADGTLYAATGEKLFMTNLDGASLTDVTAKLLKQPTDEVTAILVDRTRRNLWIATNDSLHLAQCYNFALQAQHCGGAFLEEELQMYERLRRNAPAPSIAAMAHDELGAVVGFFKDGVYLYSLRDYQYRLVYKPDNIYHWPVGALLTPTLGFVATRGDGLVVIDRTSACVSRFPDENGHYIRALATDGTGSLYIGSIGLYRAAVTDFVPN